MQGFDMPHAILLNELILEYAFAPLAVHAIHSRHCQFNATDLCPAAVGRHIDHCLQLEVIVHHALAQSLRAKLIQRAPYAGLADIHSSRTQFHRCVSGK